MPWFSYGFIVKSGFDIPLYSESLKSMVGFFTQGRRELPQEVVYIYGLYIYPLLIILLFKIQSKALSIITALLPLLPFIVATVILPINLMTYMGYGFIVTLAGSVALILQSVIKP